MNSERETRTIVAVDCYHFVGMRRGAGGAGAYVLSLVDHLARLTRLHVIASADSARYFDVVRERNPRLTVRVDSSDHAEAVRAAAKDVDILYAPFTTLPDRESYSDIPTVTAIHDLQHRVMHGCFPARERIERDDVYFAAASKADGIITFSSAERANIERAYNVSGQIGV